MLACLVVVGIIVALMAFFLLRSSNKSWIDTRTRCESALEAWTQAGLNWERSERLFAYSERMWKETGLIHLHAKGEWAPCEVCGHKIPRLALMVNADGIPTCARCSPEAKAAGRFIEPAS